MLYYRIERLALKGIERKNIKLGKILSKNFSLTTEKIPPLHSLDGRRPRFILPKSEVAAGPELLSFSFLQAGGVGE
jgi:hypothetical protein